MYPYRIRLRGPWECEPLARLVRQADGRVEAREGPVPPPCRMTMPCRWDEGGLSGFTGRVRFRRRFGLPRQIDPHEHLWLTFAGVDGAADVWLNGRLLGRHAGSEAFEFEVTGLLQARNELVVEVEAPGGPGGLWGEVALEVRCSAFLRGVRLEATVTGETARLHVAGEVVGTCERPLELYVLLDAATVLYTTVEAAPEGRSFDVVSEELGAERLGGRDRLHEVRVELVNGATAWYAVEQAFAVGASPI
jgi:hypothetical protein